ncbi:MAG: amidophosphoribosyltransferase [Xanthomonadales bacterium]|nr:amidophosphoribosyltransferase [Xanthomonadales bacterium]
MCGIVGIVGREPVAAKLCDALMVLQHRGQDAAGIATLDGDRIFLRRAAGLVRDVFKGDASTELKGHCGIGHARYPTAGSDRPDEAQPLYVNSPYGIALAHNGNLVNTQALREELFKSDRRHLNTESDSEALLNVLAHELEEYDDAFSPEQVFKAVDAVHQRCLGGYAVVATIVGQGILAFRDPNGIRPLVLGQRESVHGGKEYMVASESVALDTLDFQLIGDLAPGESVFISEAGELHRHQSNIQRLHAPCIFEYVYFARPDSMMDDISVYKARLRMGETLAEKIKRTWPDHDIDVVIPIPDTSRTSALPLAYELGVKYREGFVKNRYVGRTFIMPGQAERSRSVQRKLNAIPLEFKNKNVLLVDDSIVRGTTSKQIIEMAREAGAKKVYLASAAPPVRYANVYGIDMPATSELIASGRSVDEVCQIIGADKLIYQDLEDLIKACQEGNSKIQQFDTSCFTGEYITGVDESYLQRLEQERSDAQKSARAQVTVVK